MDKQLKDSMTTKRQRKTKFNDLGTSSVDEDEENVGEGIKKRHKTFDVEYVDLTNVKWCITLLKKDYDTN